MSILVLIKDFLFLYKNNFSSVSNLNEIKLLIQVPNFCRMEYWRRSCWISKYCFQIELKSKFFIFALFSFCLKISIWMWVFFVCKLNIIKERILFCYISFLTEDLRLNLTLDVKPYLPQNVLKRYLFEQVPKMSTEEKDKIVQKSQNICQLRI